MSSMLVLDTVKTLPVSGCPSYCHCSLWGGAERAGGRDRGVISSLLLMLSVSAELPGWDSGLQVGLGCPGSAQACGSSSRPCSLLWGTGGF